MESTKDNSFEPKKTYDKVEPVPLSNQNGLLTEPSNTLSHPMTVTSCEIDYTDGVVPPAVNDGGSKVVGGDLIDMMSARMPMKIHDYQYSNESDLTSEPYTRGVCSIQPNIGPFLDKYDNVTDYVFLTGSDLFVNLPSPVHRFVDMEVETIQTKDGVTSFDKKSLIWSLMSKVNENTSRDFSLPLRLLEGYESTFMRSTPQFYPANPLSVFLGPGITVTPADFVITDMRTAAVNYGNLRHRYITTCPYSDELGRIINTAKSLFLYTDDQSVDTTCPGKVVVSCYPYLANANNIQYRDLSEDDLHLIREIYGYTEYGREAFSKNCGKCPDFLSTFRDRDTLQKTALACADRRIATQMTNILDITSSSEAQSLCQNIYGFMTSGCGMSVSLGLSVAKPSVLDHLSILFAFSIFDFLALHFTTADDAWKVVRTTLLYFYPSCWLSNMPNWDGTMPATAREARIPAHLYDWCFDLGQNAAALTDFAPPMLTLPASFGLSGIRIVAPNLQEYRPDTVRMPRITHLANWITEVNNRNGQNTSRNLMSLRIFQGGEERAWITTLYTIFFCAYITPRCDGLRPYRSVNPLYPTRRGITITTTQFMSGMFLWSNGECLFDDGVIKDAFSEVVNTTVTSRRLSANSDLVNFLDHQRKINECNLCWLEIYDTLRWCVRSLSDFYQTAFGGRVPIQFRSSFNRKYISTVLSVYFDANKTCMDIVNGILSSNIVMSKIFGVFSSVTPALQVAPIMGVISRAYGSSPFSRYRSDVLSLRLYDPCVSCQSPCPAAASFLSDMPCPTYSSVYDLRLMSDEYIIAKGSGLKMVTDGLYLTIKYCTDNVRGDAVVEPAWPNLDLALLNSGDYLSETDHTRYFGNRLSTEASNAYSVSDTGTTPLIVSVAKSEVQLTDLRSALTKTKIFDTNVNKLSISPRTSNALTIVFRNDINTIPVGDLYNYLSPYYSPGVIVPFVEVHRIPRTKWFNVYDDNVVLRTGYVYGYLSNPFEFLPYSFNYVANVLWPVRPGPARAGFHTFEVNGHRRHRIHGSNIPLLTSAQPGGAFNATLPIIGPESDVPEKAYLFMNSSPFGKPNIADYGILTKSAKIDRPDSAYANTYFKRRQPVLVCPIHNDNVTHISESDLRLGFKLGDVLVDDQTSVAVMNKTIPAQIGPVILK